MGAEHVVAIASVAAALASWIQIHRVTEERFMRRAGARRRAEAIALRVSDRLRRWIDSGLPHNVARAGRVAAENAELQQDLRMLTDLSADLSERDAGAVSRIVVGLGEAIRVFEGYAGDQSVSGPFDRLHLAISDLKEADREIEKSLLGNCIACSRRRLAERPGALDQLAEDAGRAAAAE